MSSPKILFVCHNHPDLHPGGTEIFSHGLFQAMKSRHGLDAVYLACVNTVHRSRLPGTLFQSAGRAPDEILLWAGHFDRFTLSQIDLHGIVPEFERLLRAFQPDIVHFHHVLLMGVEALQVVRRVLPKAGIILTLHDYYPICANDGQMVTTRDRKLCRSASADSCVSCFSGTSRDQFVMRELFIKQNLSLVDRFVSPSDFLKRRYVEWGLPTDRIDVVRNGIRDAETAPHRQIPANGRRDRFAFFGHLNPYKGALVAIEAAKRLAQQVDNAISLTLHGSADFQTDEFKAELAKASEGAPFVVARGRYARDELPALMADADWVIVPSIWWENAPLIIQEAFQHRRPVICSGIGGMAESVRDGVDGLWFNAGDPRQLADKMAEALKPERWSQLVQRILPPRRMSEAADDHLALYRAVSAMRRSAKDDWQFDNVAPIAAVTPPAPVAPLKQAAPKSSVLAAPVPAPAAAAPSAPAPTVTVPPPRVVVPAPPPPVVAPAPPVAAVAAEPAIVLRAVEHEQAKPAPLGIVQAEDVAPLPPIAPVMPAPVMPTPAVQAAATAASHPEASVVVPIHEPQRPALEAETVIPPRDVESPPAMPAVAPQPAAENATPDTAPKPPEVGVMDDGRLIDEVDFRSSYRLRRLLRGGGG